MTRTAHAPKSIRRIQGEQATTRVSPRKGLFWDGAAGQWATRIGKPETKLKTAYNPESVALLKQIKESSARIVEAGGEDSWMFVLLALNAGAYQHDIAALTYENLYVEKGSVWLWWQRQKTLVHNRDTVWIRSDIWPELWTMMKKHLAKDDVKTNPQRLLFLSKRGKPLYSVAAGKGKNDIIHNRYYRACQAAKKGDEPAKVQLAFMQLRKIALNAIKAHGGGSDDTVRRFAGHKIEGVLRCYLADEFGDVTAALGKWRQQLQADGLL